MQGLYLVVESRVDGPQLGKHPRIIGNQRAEHLKPLDCGLEVSSLLHMMQIMTIVSTRIVSKPNEGQYDVIVHPSLHT